MVGVTVLTSVISGISGQLTSAVPSAPGETTVILVGAGFVISFVVSVLVKMGTINIYLKAHDNIEAAKFEDLWAPQRIVSFTLASLLVGVIVLLGMLLLVIPGIVWALRYSLVPYLVMDRGLDVGEALKESGRITYGHKAKLLGLFFVIGLVNILGAILLLVGLLVTIPLSALAVVHAYRTLSAQSVG